MPCVAARIVHKSLSVVKFGAFHSNMIDDDRYVLCCFCPSMLMSVLLDCAHKEVMSGNLMLQIR